MVSRYASAARFACGVFTVWIASSGLALATGGGGGVPEIGPNSLATAMTILIGGLLMLTGRRRRKSDSPADNHTKPPHADE